MPFISGNASNNVSTFAGSWPARTQAGNEAPSRECPASPGRLRWPVAPDWSLLTQGAHIRALIAQELARDDFPLHSLHIEDLGLGSGLVEVTAELQRHGRDDIALEAAVSRLSLEPSVSSVTWNTCEPAALVGAEE